MRTDLSPDLAIATLEDWITPAERTLLREGRNGLATQFRTALHDGIRAEAMAAVEEITGRRIAAFLTAHQHDPEIAIIAFHFSPPAGLGEER